MSRGFLSRYNARLTYLLAALVLGFSRVACADDDGPLDAASPSAPPATTDAGSPVDEFFTDWQIADSSYDLLPTTVGQNPQALADRYARELLVVREFQEAAANTTDEDDTSVGIIEARGAADDSISGIDVRLSLTKAEAGSWSIAKIETRALCARGKPTDNLCP